MANLVDGIEKQKRCLHASLAPGKLLYPWWHVAICFSDHESASSAEKHWIGKMVNAPAPVAAEAAHLELNLI